MAEEPVACRNHSPNLSLPIQTTIARGIRAYAHGAQIQAETMHHNRETVRAPCGSSPEAFFSGYTAGHITPYGTAPTSGSGHLAGPPRHWRTPALTGAVPLAFANVARSDDGDARSDY